MEIELLKEKIRHLELSQMKAEVENKHKQQAYKHLRSNANSTESSNGSLASNDVDYDLQQQQQHQQLGGRQASQQLSLPLQLHDVNSGLAAKRKVSPLTLTSSASIGGVGGHPMSR